MRFARAIALGCAAAALGGAWLPCLAADRAGGAGESSCIQCHSDPSWVGEELVDVVSAHAAGVHAQAGISCVQCHGGNPDPGLAQDMMAAMDPGYGPMPYVGVPKAADVPSFCGECHASAERMREFGSDIRVDQVERYWTSGHGKALKQGDTKVATCVDCHPLHGILPADDARSPVYVKNVANTCATCHGDAQLMRDYELPVDQVALWERSVHGHAILERGQLSAPTCNDCHGSHGAAPPGIDHVADVCGRCHPRESELFQASPKAAGFAEHRSFLEGGTPCSACHSVERDTADLDQPILLHSCVACHHNHGIVRARVTMLAPVPSTPCAFCHVGPGTSLDAVMGEAAQNQLEGQRPEREEVLEIQRHFVDVRDELLAQAREQGLEGEDLFDWLLEHAEKLPYHTRAVEGDEEQVTATFADLMRKFRLHETRFEYEDPIAGEAKKRSVVRCGSCHVDEPDLGQPVGLQTSRRMLQELRHLMLVTARADRVLAKAQRAGVHAGKGPAQLDEAIETNIALALLVHTFDASEDGEFAKKHAEGIEHARGALLAGHRALEELDYRRNGLVVALVVILIALVALGLKIRQLS
jgi:hypothetical protein